MNKKHAILLLGSIMAAMPCLSYAADANLPPNSLDMRDFNPNVQAQSAYSAVGMANLPPPYTNVIAPSIQNNIANQLEQYKNEQLTPNQLQQLKQLELRKQRILATPYTSVPAPVVRSISPDLSAGKTPPVIRVSKNLLTSIVFTDLDGNPWYIEKVIVNRDQFDDTASTNPDGKPTNVLTLEPVDAIEYGSVSVTLVGQTVPVIFLLASGQNEVDIRVDARIQGENPDAPKAQVNLAGMMSVSGVDENSLKFLDGFIPEAAEQLLSSDPSVTAWQFNNQTYVKTRFDVLYPSYHSRATTANGVNIYRFEMNPTSATFMQRNGQPVTVSFSEMPYNYTVDSIIGK